nr:hypothetical protein [Bacteroidales bacterium]
LNVVGEVHITRKQYLDGSIPTGFQRTAIIGVEGEIYLKHKKVRLIQLSIEEDSCREISDIGHTRIYKTDRLGMPLIETVTYPDMLNPEEVREACDYIRFLNRSTGKVRTGMGAGRQDVNVSCKGGTRVEIKGVAHTKWIPELTHNEAFRQFALLNAKNKLLKIIINPKDWKISTKFIEFSAIKSKDKFIKEAKVKGYKIFVANLPGFKGILSHFTQPGKIFADELSDRLKVIACIEKPNMFHSEELNPNINDKVWTTLRKSLNAKDEDAQIIVWGPEADMKTAIDTIEERCIMAMEGIPRETRKSFIDGTTIFERVLPGADRMYPDTDSKPIPLEDELIDNLSKNLPTEIIDRYNLLKKWGVPEDTYNYIFKRNLFPLLEKIVNDFSLSPVFVGTYLGHRFKFVEGHYKSTKDFNYNKIYECFKFLKQNNLDFELVKFIMPVIYQYPLMDFDSVLTSINFKKIPKEEILSKIPFLKNKYKEVCLSKNGNNEPHWIMGQLRKTAVGNLNLKDLANTILS